jgi:hypothetical protein
MFMHSFLRSQLNDLMNVFSVGFLVCKNYGGQRLFLEIALFLCSGKAVFVHLAPQGVIADS